MSREQIEKMEKLQDKLIKRSCTEFNLKTSLLLTEAANAIGTLLDGYRKQEWISVDEMVPKKWQKCLCYYPDKDYGSKVVVDYAETDDGGFAEQFQFGKPSHWMPIPEPPKMKGGAE